ncbi:sirohydrochlorin chelatase [Nocardia bovistercoris]|uniref:Sirohydrochlorin chelatase n=1 Tax=Nocardia bovistercoris TaxID=2785916 RepID=A0A931IB32_9NOCA|nr:sirohydrochlorin chelatase [Nocardia bovistercoris]MBH0777223.1 sirohydrochlorin chelatase [Nocardia bovistercoris]
MRTIPAREAALIVVAHGSRDPRSAATVSTVTSEIASERTDLDVHLAFLDLSAPSVEQVLDTVAARGHHRAVVVPLLLGSAFHARVDLPGLLRAARARHPRLLLTQADVLGPDPRLIAALRDRVLEHVTAESGARITTSDGRRNYYAHKRIPPEVADLGVIVAAVGSSSASANARTTGVARRLASMTDWATETCFATAEPTVSEAGARLRERGCDRIVVAPWFLAPGLLTDRLHRAAPDLPHAAVLGPHPALTGLVWDRYDSANAIIPLTA